MTRGRSIWVRAMRLAARRLHHRALSDTLSSDGTIDTTRTVHFGKPTKEQKRAFTRVLQGHIAIDSLFFPEGTTGLQMDVLARQALWKEGMNFQHGTGHGVGEYLSVHEGPEGLGIGQSDALRCPQNPLILQAHQPFPSYLVTLCPTSRGTTRSEAMESALRASSASWRSRHVAASETRSGMVLSGLRW